MGRIHGSGGGLIMAKIPITTELDQRKNKIQEKILGSDVTTSGVIASLTFSNLVVGKVYQVYGQVQWGGSWTGDPLFRALHDGNRIAIQRPRNINTSFAGAFPLTTFTATATTVEFEHVISSTSSLIGNGSKDGTWVGIIERNDSEITTDFT